MQDVAYLGLYAVIAVIGIMIAVALINSFTAALTPVWTDIGVQTGMNMTDSENAMVQVKTVSNNFDYIIPLLVVVGALMMFAFAYYVPSSPMFLPTAIVFSMFVLGACYIVGLMGQEILKVGNDTLGVSLPLTSFIFTNWLLISVLYVLIMGIALYAKPSFGGARQ